MTLTLLCTFLKHLRYWNEIWASQFNLVEDHQSQLLTEHVIDLTFLVGIQVFQFRNVRVVLEKKTVVLAKNEPKLNPKSKTNTLQIPKEKPRKTGKVAVKTIGNEWVFLTINMQKQYTTEVEVYNVTNSQNRSIHSELQKSTARSQNADIPEHNRHNTWS